MEQLTVMTGLHRKLIHILERRGFEMIYEISFPPYTVDIYVPHYHIAFEADGPQHSIRHDRIRDALLLKRYKLPVCRFTQDDIEHDTIGTAARSVIFAREHEDSVKQRRSVAYMEAPWI